MDLFDRMLELSGQGFYCARILMILALESEEKEDPDLIRAMGGIKRRPWIFRKSLRCSYGRLLFSELLSGKRRGGRNGRSPGRAFDRKAGRVV